MKASPDKFVSLRIASIRNNPAQPQGRAQENAPRLVPSVREKGLLNPPTVALYRGEYYFIDGHTRTEALRLLSHTHVRAIEQPPATSEQDLIERFHLSNHQKVNISPAKELHTYVHSSTTRRSMLLDSLRHNNRTALANQILKFMETVGSQQVAEEFVDEYNCPPSILGVLGEARSRLSKYYESESIPANVDILRWVLKHKAQNYVGDVNLNNKKEVEQLYNRIVNDSSWSSRYSVPRTSRKG